MTHHRHLFKQADGKCTSTQHSSSASPSTSSSTSAATSFCTSQPTTIRIPISSSPIPPRITSNIWKEDWQSFASWRVGWNSSQCSFCGGVGPRSEKLGKDMKTSTNLLGNIEIHTGQNSSRSGECTGLWEKQMRLFPFRSGFWGPECSWDLVRASRKYGAANCPSIWSSRYTPSLKTMP